MKRRKGRKWIGGLLIGSLFVTGVSYAASSAKVVVNGSVIETDVAPQIMNGRVMVPIRAIAESLGAHVSWDQQNQTAVIQGPHAMEMESQVKQLEAALAPKEPEEAAERYAEGVRTRNGALQFAVMSPELKEILRDHYESLHWVTGTSSPWVAEFSIEGVPINEGQWEYKINYILTSSTGERIPSSERIVVKKYDKSWLVSERSESAEILPAVQSIDGVYTNPIDRYQLTLPPEWQKVKIIEAGRSVDFLYPTSNPGNYQSFVRLVAMSEEEWRQVQAEGGPALHQLKEITKQDGSVFLYVLPLDMILEGKELEEYNRMAEQIPSIIRSFKLKAQ